MKKNLIIIILSIIIVALGILAYLLLKPANEIIISFDTDGGTPIQEMKIKKGQSINLPKPTKEEFNFLGWYVRDNKINDTYQFMDNTTLTAKWEKIINTFTVSFDSKGGSTVKSITVECNKELTLPANPTRSGYTFVAWTDKNGVTIHDKALLACENIKLYANWNKVEVKKTYTCPTGYKLNGTLCTLETAPKEKCPDGTKLISGGICATITGSARKDYSKSCEKKHITYKSFAGNVDGKVVNWGITGCAYYKTNDSTKQECESHQFTWVTPENACYVKWDTTTVIKVCSHLNGYVDVPNPNAYVTNTGLNSGCYPTSSKVKYCDSGYTLTNGKCIKTVNATVK